MAIPTYTNLLTKSQNRNYINNNSNNIIKSIDKSKFMVEMKIIILSKCSWFDKNHVVYYTLHSLENSLILHRVSSG